MKPEERRRLGAGAALVAGVFVGLTLIHAVPTGPLGRLLGESLWRLLGGGAVGLPVLGLGLAFAGGGFGRLPQLDMKRAAILLGGLTVLVPFTIGVVTNVPAQAFDPPLADWDLAARLTGILPGFGSRLIIERIGQLGGLLLALPLAPLMLHPLQWLEKRARGPSGGRASSASAADLEERDEIVAPPSLLSRVERPFKPDAQPSREALGRKDSSPREAEDELPDLNKLQKLEDRGSAPTEEQLHGLGQALLDTLRTFKIEVDRIKAKTSGPVVTQFEIVPPPGVKAGRIIGLADDLAIGMQVMSIRVAPIPGRGAVGVEVPNPTVRLVTLRELLETEEWKRSRAVMPMVLGRDLENKPVVTDLAKMPHLLIAGATGSGKSVAINTIITGLIYRYTPADLRMLMIDPKMVELSMYNALPHLRHAVVTNNHDAARVLKWAVHEMNRRYELLHANGARNLADFNRKLEEGKPLRHPPRPSPTLASISSEAETTPPPPPADEVYGEGRLPHLVIIVDEMGHAPLDRKSTPLHSN